MSETKKIRSTDSHYDDLYLGHTLFGLQGDIDDLEKWSVYNDDQLSDEITEVKEKIEELSKLFR